MAKIIYPSVVDIEVFIEVITREEYRISKYLPPVSDFWYQTISECIQYVESTGHYGGECSVCDLSARLLYKITKRHEIADSNKRSAVITVFLFCLLNDYRITEPSELKRQAKRIASTKGRANEELIKSRVSKDLQRIVVKDN